MNTTLPENIHEASPPPLEEHAVALLRAVTQENLTFSYFAILMAVKRREVKGETPSLAGIAIECGYSYHATRHIVLRTHYLEKIDGTPVALRLTPEGLNKVDRVCQRLKRQAAKNPISSHP
jgi:hypothetical protein